MECIKCRAQIADDSVFCNYCGKRQTPPAHAPKRRGNGQGTIYKSPSGSWIAEVTLGYYTDAAGKLKRRKRKKYGFRTKKMPLHTSRRFVLTGNVRNPSQFSSSGNNSRVLLKT